jgi:hypothetical protein
MHLPLLDVLLHCQACCCCCCYCCCLVVQCWELLPLLLPAQQRVPGWHGCSCCSAASTYPAHLTHAAAPAGCGKAIQKICYNTVAMSQTAAKCKKNILYQGVSYTHTPDVYAMATCAMPLDENPCS